MFARDKADLAAHPLLPQYIAFRKAQLVCEESPRTSLNLKSSGTMKRNGVDKSGKKKQAKMEKKGLSCLLFSVFRKNSGANQHTTKQTAVALCYSTAEYCGPVRVI